MIYLREKNYTDETQEYEKVVFDLLNILLTFEIPVEEALAPEPRLLLYVADCILAIPTAGIHLIELYDRINIIFSLLSGIIHSLYYGRFIPNFFIFCWFVCL